jgi:hypothetical protein
MCFSDFGGGKKNNLIQSFCHITYITYIYAKIWGETNILTLVLSEKNLYYLKCVSSDANTD